MFSCHCGVFPKVQSRRPVRVLTTRVLPSRVAHRGLMYHQWRRRFSAIVDFHRLSEGPAVEEGRELDSCSMTIVKMSAVDEELIRSQMEKLNLLGLSTLRAMGSLLN